MSRRNRPPAPLPILMTELMLASWETIARRSWLMARGSCSEAEYRRMVDEKALAAYRSGLVLAGGGGAAAITAVLAPWHRLASANAKRLRKR
jgi:hypothetical protein